MSAYVKSSILGKCPYKSMFVCSCHESRGAKWLGHMLDESLKHAHRDVGVWEHGNVFDSNHPSKIRVVLGYETLLMLISQLYVAQLQSDAVGESHEKVSTTQKG